MKRYIPFAALFVLLAGFTKPNTGQPPLADVAARVARDAGFKNFAEVNLKLLNNIHIILNEKKELPAEFKSATPERRKYLVTKVARLLKVPAGDVKNAYRQLDQKLSKEYGVPAKDKQAVVALSLEQFFKEKAAVHKLPARQAQSGCVSAFVQIISAYSHAVGECEAIVGDFDICMDLIIDMLIGDLVMLDEQIPGCLDLILNNI